MYKVLSIGTRENCEFDTMTHFHEQWEFVYYTKGYGTIINGNVEKDFCPYFCVVYPPHMPHSEHAGAAFSNIYIQADIGDALPCEPYYYDDRDMHELEMVFSLLRYHFIRKRENWKDVVQALLTLLVELLRSKPLKDNNNDYIDTAMSLIIKGMHDKSFDIDTIYHNIPLSKTYFTAVFKQNIGMTPLQYLIEKRMENAKRLLLQKDDFNYSIGFIADMCGYSDLYYFSRIFKKTTGLSPSQWYKQNHS